MQRVLITGSNGFLGQKVVDLFSQNKEFAITAISKNENRNPNIENYAFHQLDIINLDELNTFLSTHKFNIIVHTAAVTSVESCEADKPYAHVMNVLVPETIAKYCKKEQTYLIHLSTDFVFDGTKDAPYTEDDLPNPLSEYGSSKLAAEKIIMAIDCESAILRTILLYGINADTNRSNIVLWAKTKLEQNEKINVVCDQWRMPTFVDDLAKACLLAAQNKVKGIFHICGSEFLSISEIVYKVAHHWNLPTQNINEITASLIGHLTNRPIKTAFDLSKSKQLLNYTPTSFCESLKKIEEQFKLFRN